MTLQTDIPFPPRQVKPVDPREFAFALQVGSATFSGRMPMESLSRREFLVEDENGRPQEIILDDTRLNRAAVAILDQFAPDFEKFQSLMMRYFALLRLTPLEKMKQWQTTASAENSVAIHPAVLTVAATLPLDGSGGFDEMEFFSKVEEVASGIAFPR